MGKAAMAMAAAGAAKTVHDDVMGPRHLAGVKVDAATTEDAIAYREKLGNVDATTRTADNIMTVFGDPKKVLGIAMTVLLIVWVLSKFGDKIGDFLGGIVSPVKHLFDVHRAERLTGTVATLSNEQAQVLADRIYACFQPSGDDEGGVYSCLRTLNTAADWEAVCNAFGERTCRKKILGFTSHNEKHDLPNMIQCNFTDSETEEVRQILANIGVTF